MMQLCIKTELSYFWFFLKKNLSVNPYENIEFSINDLYTEAYDL